MSEHAHLSTPDPEYAALILQLPPGAGGFDMSSIEAVRAQGKALGGVHNEGLKARLPAESTYTIKDDKVPIEGGEIAVRSIVPSGVSEGKTFPVLVWFHGGGWVMGDLDADDARLKIIAVQHQISVVNVDYRLAPEHPFPAPWEDCYAATKWAVENASRLSASFEKGFLVAGVSAGGNLAASTAHRARDDPFFSKTPITGQVLLNPVLLDPNARVPEEWKSELISYEQNKDSLVLSKDAIVKMISIVNPPPQDTTMSVPLHPSHTNLAPAYFQIAGLDPLRDEGLLYVRLLKEASVKTNVDVYPGVPHGFDIAFPHLKVSSKALSDLDGGIKWLLAQTGA